jgi:predicted O-methyltransferase YrrM
MLFSVRLRLIASALHRTAIHRTGWPVKARHAELSVIASPDDDPGQPSPELLRLALTIVEAALGIDLQDLTNRSHAAARYLNVFPGEHYRLLAGAVRETRARQVVDIGTYTGLSALALLHELPREGRVTTFDLWPWQESAQRRPFAGLGHEPTALRVDDFADGRLVQELGDLSDITTFEKFRALLSDADLIFTDGPKDGHFERAFLAMLQVTPRSKPCLVIFDDIRILGMVRTWREITLPKLDLTSFGHWTGTGLVWLSSTA